MFRKNQFNSGKKSSAKKNNIQKKHYIDQTISSNNTKEKKTIH